MKDNFDLKKFLTENKLTYNSKILNEDVNSFSDVIQVVGVENVEDALKVIEKYENEFNDGPVSLDQAKELVADLRATDEDAHDKNITNLIVKAFNIKLKGVSEKKIKENFPPSSNTHLPEMGNAEDFDVATAFKKARVDMSKPVAVMYHYGYAQYSNEDTDIMSAEAAVKKLEAERQENRKNYTDDGREVPSDIHGYEFENYSVLEEHMPEGHEYKLSYFLDGDYTYSITQEK